MRLGISVLLVGALAFGASAGGGISVLCGDASCPVKNGVTAVGTGVPVEFRFEGDVAGVSDVQWSFGDGYGQFTKHVQPVKHTYRTAPTDGYTVTVSFWRQVSETTKQKEEYSINVLVAPVLSGANGDSCSILGLFAVPLNQTICSGINNLIGVLIGYLSHPSARR